MRVTYEEVKSKISMIDVMEKYGIPLKKNNCACPLHGGDNPTGFGIHDQGTKWTCRTRNCGKAGSVIDFVAAKEGIDAPQAFIRIKEMFNMVDDEPVKKVKKTPPKRVGPSIWYDYVTAEGDLAYRIERVTLDQGQKRFLPQLPDGTRSCPVSERILYNLKMIADSIGDEIFLCEGEKTADAVISCGMIGTTFGFGCGSWLDQYADPLKGKKVVFLPDADEGGEKWLKLVSEGLAGKVDSTMTIHMPDSFVVNNNQFSGHDVADYLEVNGKEDTIKFLTYEMMDAEEIPRGIDRSSLNIATDICRKAVFDLKNQDSKNIMDLRRMYGKYMDIDMFAGDLLMIIAPTGVGKTRILHAFPRVFDELNFMIFDLELTHAILGIRYTAMQNGISFKEARQKIQNGYDIEIPVVENVFLPKKPHLTVDLIKEEVDRVEMITGRRIHVVAIDYVAKMNRLGNATESVERHISEFKNYCSMEERWGIFTTQSSRGENKADPDYRMPKKEDAIHSSALEQSCQEALCFCYKSETERDTLLLKVDKFSHGDMPIGTFELSANNLNIEYKRMHTVKSNEEW